MDLFINSPCERSRKDSEFAELSTSGSLPMFEGSAMNSQDTGIMMNLDTPPASPPNDSHFPNQVQGFADNSSHASEDLDLPNQLHKLVNSFNIICVAGSGAFGTVIKVEHKIDGQHYAIKCIRLEHEIDGIMQEAKLLASLNHKNIVRYYDSWFDDRCIANIPNVSYVVLSNSCTGSSRVSSRSKWHLCIQMEWCQTNLTQLIKNGLDKQPSRAWKIFWQIVEGLAYLHAEGMIHRDLHTGNILLDDTDCVKIADLGLTTISSGEDRYTQKDDIYSLALIFSQMFGLTSVTIGNVQFGNEYTTPQPEEKENVQQNCIIDVKKFKPADLLRWLLNCKTRPTCAELLEFQKRLDQVSRHHILKDTIVNQYECTHADADRNKIKKSKLD